MDQLGPKLSKKYLMMNLLERVRYDMEKCFPDDEKSNEAIRNLLYDFAWKVKEEGDEN